MISYNIALLFFILSMILLTFIKYLHLKIKTVSIKERFKFKNITNHKTYLIKIDIQQNIVTIFKKLNFFNNDYENVEKINIDNFCEKISFNKKTKKSFLKFLDNQKQNNFIHLFDEKIKKNSIFSFLFNLLFNKPKNKRKCIIFEKKYSNSYNTLLDVFFFNNYCINVYNDNDNNFLTEKILHKMFFLIKIDYYFSDKDKTEQYFDILKEIIFSCINNHKIYFLIKKEKQKNNIIKLTFFIFDLYNRKLSEVLNMIKKIIKITRCFFEIKKIPFFPIYSSILHNKKQTLNTGNWENVMNNIANFGFDKKIPLITDYMINNIRKFENNILQNYSLSLKEIFDVETEQSFAFLPLIKNNQITGNLLLTENTKNTLEIVKNIVKDIQQKYKLNNDDQKKIFLKTNYLDISMSLLKELDINICQNFNTTIYIIFETENNELLSTVTETKDITEKIKECKEKLQNIKFGLCIKNNYPFFNYISNNIFDCFIIKIINNFHFKNIARKLLKYDKAIILENIETVNKAYIAIKNGIRYITNNELRNKIEKIRSIKRELQKNNGTIF